jgi:predicted RNA polymerase sigma factor
VPGTEEALLAAAMQWPDDGVPEHPPAWLITVASRRLTDLLRGEQARRRREDTVASRAIPFAMPPGGQRSQRLAAVPHVLSLIFNEGYASTSGPELHRRELSAQDRAAGTPTTSPRGWRSSPARARPGATGPYQLQAAIAAVHDQAPSAQATDRPPILALDELLRRISDNPVLALNQAVAVAMVDGPHAGLELLGALRADQRIAAATTGSTRSVRTWGRWPVTTPGPARPTRRRPGARPTCRNNATSTPERPA